MSTRELLVALRGMGKLLWAQITGHATLSKQEADCLYQWACETEGMRWLADCLLHVWQRDIGPH